MNFFHNILIIGNFGYKASVYNGQSIRTRTVYESIVKYRKNSTINFIDISDKRKFNYLKLLVMLVLADQLVIMPGRDGISKILKIIGAFKKLKRTSIVVIGGWLGEKVNYDIELRNRLQEAKSLLVQTKALKRELNDANIMNVKIFPNYRNISHISSTKSVSYSRNRFVFYSRVCKEKGTNLAIDAIEEYNLKSDKKIHLDIYGPIQEDYKNEFESKIKDDEYINYLGILQNEQAIEVLAHYDCMLFPTHYDGEGFPGVILEAYMAGIPVIASRWKFNDEFVFDGRTGYLHTEKSKDDLLLKIQEFVSTNIEFSQNCKLEAKKYSEEKVYPILDELIKNRR